MHVQGKVRFARSCTIAERLHGFADVQLALPRCNTQLTQSQAAAVSFGSADAET